jgi:transcriptional regulator with GAF, ATPase, and Fis domain
LQKFHPAMIEAWAVIYAPLILNERAIGLLWVANTRTPFESHMTDIMSALADYGSIAIFNNRILTAMQARSRQLEEALEAAGQAPVDGQAAGSSLGAKQIASQVRDPLTVVMGNLGKFRTGEMGEIPAGNRAAVDVLYRQVSEVVELIDSVVPPNTGGL